MRKPQVSCFAAIFLCYPLEARESVVGVATRYGPGFETRWKQVISSSRRPIQSGPAAHPTSPTKSTRGKAAGVWH